MFLFLKKVKIFQVWFEFAYIKDNSNIQWYELLEREKWVK